MSSYVFPAGSLDRLVNDLVSAEARGYAAAWAPQVFGWDVLTALALAGRQTSRLRLGTAVVPAHPFHPLILAQSALTTQAACGGRLTLGIGLSHAFIVEGVWGYSYDRPVSWLREYLAALLPALRGEQPRVEGERITARPPRPLDTPGADAPPVLLAALAPRMLQLAGRECTGTVTWLTGPRALAEHIIPTIHAAEEPGGPSARVVAGLPVCVTTDPARARARAEQQFHVYADVPSYRAVLDREGVASPADLALIGTADEVAERVDELARIGVDEFMACVFGDPDEQEATHACLTGQDGSR